MSYSRAISFELRDGNVVAHLMVVALAWTLVVLTAQFRARRLWFSAASTSVCLLFLALIPLTEPETALHNAAFGSLVLLSLGLCLIWSLETFDVFQVLPPFTPVAVGLLCYWTVGVGGAQLMLIGSLLLSLNLTARHIETRA